MVSCEIDDRRFKELLWQIIDHPKSIFSLNNGEINWLESKSDIEIFGQVLNILEISKDLGDSQFIAQHFDRIISLLDTCNLFKGLNSTSIVVTLAHHGTSPKEHSYNVLLKLRTEGVSPEVRVMLRLSALFHDVGKASCAGMSREEVAAVLSKQEPPWNEISYPNHSELSTLVLKK